MIYPDEETPAAPYAPSEYYCSVPGFGDVGPYETKEELEAAVEELFRQHAVELAKGMFR